MNKQQLIEIPKTELHVHIEALMNYATLKELATKYNLGVFQIDLLKQSIANGYANIEEFFKNWHYLNATLKSPEDFERITYEYLKSVSEFNTKYVELNVNIMRQIEKGLDPRDVIYAIYRGQLQAEFDFGVISRTLLSYSRDFSHEDGRKIVDLADEFKNYNVGGIDIAGNEKLKPNKNYIDVFQYAVKKNIRRTAHAGEGAGQNSISDAVNGMKVSRIGHGLDATEDNNTLALLKSNNICVEVCVTSNVATGALDVFENHPIKKFLVEGINLTLSTDDPTLLGVSLLDEYERVAKTWNLTVDDLKNIYRSGVKYAFVEDEIKQELLKKTLDR